MPSFLRRLTRLLLPLEALYPRQLLLKLLFKLSSFFAGVVHLIRLYRERAAEGVFWPDKLMLFQKSSLRGAPVTIGGGQYRMTVRELVGKLRYDFRTKLIIREALIRRHRHRRHRNCNSLGIS
jgi:hypothetical protein